MRGLLDFGWLAAIAGLVTACTTATSPPTLGGVWFAALAIQSPNDTLFLLLPDSTGSVLATARVAPRTGFDYAGVGTLTETMLVVTVQAPPFGSSLEIRAERRNELLAGTIKVFGRADTPLILQRFPARAAPLAGRWVLVEIRGIQSTPGPGWLDTLLLADDGRIQIASRRFGCNYTTTGYATGGGARLIFEQLWSALTAPCLQFRFRDTLAVEGTRLIRRRPITEGTLEEIFERR